MDQLYGIEPTDAATLGTVLIFMSAIAIVAAVIPAARAARIDPVLTLRHESGD
jgi:ABC-type lipoprotein release transport system permease subunit